MDEIFGEDPEKLYRKDGPSTSAKAAYDVDTKTWEKRVLAIIRRYTYGFGKPKPDKPDTLDGCISDQVRHVNPGASYSSRTARYISLEDKGLISRGPDERKGDSGSDQMVMRAITPQPDCEYVCRVWVGLSDGYVATLETTVVANNPKTAYRRAKQKMITVKNLGVQKLPPPAFDPNNFKP